MVEILPYAELPDEPNDGQIAVYVNTGDGDNCIMVDMHGGRFAVSPFAGWELALSMLRERPRHNSLDQAQKIGNASVNATVLYATGMPRGQILQQLNGITSMTYARYRSSYSRFVGADEPTDAIRKGFDRYDFEVIKFATSDYSSLTDQERVIASHISAGKSLVDTSRYIYKGTRPEHIAYDYDLVCRHASNIYRKLGVNSLQAMVTLCQLIEDEPSI